MAWLIVGCLLRNDIAHTAYIVSGSSVFFPWPISWQRKRSIITAKTDLLLALLLLLLLPPLLPVTERGVRACALSRLLILYVCVRARPCVRVHVVEREGMRECSTGECAPAIFLV